MINNLISHLQKNYFLTFIYLYVLIMPWNFTNGIMGFSSIILLIWWLIIGKKNGYFKKLKNILTFKPIVLLILFMLWSYLSLLWTEDYEWSEIALKYYKYYWILIPVLFTAVTTNEAKKLLHIFIISLGIYAIFSLSIAFSLIEIINDPSNTNPVSISNPRGILAYAIVTPYMAIATLSSLVLAIYSNHKNLKILFSISFIVSFTALFLNNGRIGQLSFFLTILSLMLIYRRYLFNYKVILGISTILIGSILFFNYTGKLQHFTNGLNELKSPEKKEYDGSFGVRLYMDIAAIELIPHHPLIGAGAGDNINEFIEYTKTHPSKATWLRSYHNQHFDTLTKYGIIGYILLWGSVFMLLYSLKGNKKYFPLAFIFFSITFFDGLGDIILLMKPYNNIFTLIFILFSIIALNKHENNKTIDLFSS